MRGLKGTTLLWVNFVKNILNNMTVAYLVSSQWQRVWYQKWLSSLTSSPHKTVVKVCSRSFSLANCVIVRTHSCRAQVVINYRWSVLRSKIHSFIGCGTELRLWPEILYSFCKLLLQWSILLRNSCLLSLLLLSSFLPFHLRHGILIYLLISHLVCSFLYLNIR